jgi:aminopeptidase N
MIYQQIINNENRLLYLINTFHILKITIFAPMLLLSRYIFLAFILISCYSFGQVPRSNIFDFEEIVEIEKSQSNFKSFTETQNVNLYDVKYYRLRLNVDPDTLYISGNVTVFFIPNQDISTIVFDLNNILTVDSVRYKNTLTSFTHSKDAITINTNFSENTLDSITLFYQGQPPLYEASFKLGDHNGVPIIWTLSEPYGAKDWWPCKQSLTDKADSVDMYVTTPSGNKVAGNGNLISETENGDSTITTYWKSRYPIVPYLVALAVTPYAEFSFYSNLKEGRLFVQNYIYKEDSAAVINQLLATDTLLQFYDSVIGPYPFMNEKYGHAQFERGGGMEHQTMSFMSHFGFGLNAHELAHQWFGDKITCGSWQDIWLNEGFATYFAGLPLETMYGGSEWTNWKETFLNRAISQPNGSVFVDDTTSVSRIFDPTLSYAKGGYVLHMLRNQIGDKPFFDGVKSYISDSALIYKTALTSDFFNHIEAQTGSDLSTFVNQWIYGQGFPSYNLEWNQVGHELKLKLAQTTSDKSVPFFYLDVPVLIESESGDSLWIKISHVENDQKEIVPVSFTVSRITIDPDLDLISKANFVINISSFTDINIYPNPSIDFINVAPGGEFTKITSYKVYSANGKEMESVEHINYTSEWQINTSQWADGNYKIVLFSEEKSITKGIVIIR